MNNNSFIKQQNRAEGNHDAIYHEASVPGLNTGATRAPTAVPTAAPTRRGSQTEKDLKGSVQALVLSVEEEQLKDSESPSVRSSTSSASSAEVQSPVPGIYPTPPQDVSSNSTPNQVASTPQPDDASTPSSIAPASPQNKSPKHSRKNSIVSSDKTSTLVVASSTSSVSSSSTLFTPPPSVPIIPHLKKGETVDDRMNQLKKEIADLSVSFRLLMDEEDTDGMIDAASRLKDASTQLKFYEKMKKIEVSPDKKMKDYGKKDRDKKMNDPVTGKGRRPRGDSF